MAWPDDLLTQMQPRQTPGFDDMDAGLDALGANMEPDEVEEDKGMSREDLIWGELIDNLTNQKQNSLAFQESSKTKNTQALKEADTLRGKLGG
jgi:hypothetical protein